MSDATLIALAIAVPLVVIAGAVCLTRLIEPIIPPDPLDELFRNTDERSEK